MYCIDKDALNKYKIIDRSNFKKINIEDDFLSKNECNELTNCVLNLPKIRSLTRDIFDENLSHFSLIFNKYSKNDFLTFHYNLKPVYDIFEKIKLPNTNAYFFNSNIMNASNIINEKSKGIGYHYDAGSIELCDENGKIYMPICSTVIYIKVPETFIGGTLKMHDFGYLECHNPGEIEVRPKIGRKVVFRGDMPHRVLPIYSEKGEQRISIVFDQYDIPENRLNEVSFRVV